MIKGEVMRRLEALGNETMRKHNAKNGAGSNQFGVKMGDIRTLAKEIKVNPALAKELWATGNLDARLLATLLMKPKALSSAEIDELVQSVETGHLSDWLTTHVVKQHPQKESLRQEWMQSTHSMQARAGWSLTTERVIKSPQGLDLDALLSRIEAEMGTALELVQWTMNFCLGEIGITSAPHRERAIAIGEKLGVYREYPTSKGCVSPFVPIWVSEMVKRQG